MDTGDRQVPDAGPGSHDFAQEIPRDAGAGSEEAGLPESQGAAGPDDASLDHVRVPGCDESIWEYCGKGKECDEDPNCRSCPAGQVCLLAGADCLLDSPKAAQCIDDPCRGAPLDCACGAAVCRSLEQRAGMVLVCGVHEQMEALICGVSVSECLSPDTPIQTPEGAVPVALLQQGDLVYSLEPSGIVVVPIAVAAARRVFAHQVLELALDDEAVVHVSESHPLLDGRPAASLKVGARVAGGRVVTAREVIPYGETHTYDVLPGSSTGAYLAGGVWMRSTLAVVR
ncbi:MAG: hypothetical protein OXU20_12320 [Myxococcales bacterium]|nr:hypothetical protein [Myxococcales bacterium]MDD9971391.1 hypothetical protein [Myxococcales bacterium]